MARNAEPAKSRAKRYAALNLRAAALRAELDTIEETANQIRQAHTKDGIPERTATAIERGLLAGKSLRGEQGPSDEARVSRQAARAWLEELFPNDPIWPDVLGEWAYEHLGYDVKSDLVRFLHRWRGGPGWRASGDLWTMVCLVCGTALSNRDLFVLHGAYVAHAFTRRGHRRRTCPRRVVDKADTA